MRKVERAQRGSGVKGLSLSIGLQSTLEADDGREEGRLLSAEVVFLVLHSVHVVDIVIETAV